MKLFIDKLFKSSFVKNVAIMATGTAGAQALNMILSPIITRLYGPEAFGVLSTFVALTSVIIPIAALSYPIAIVLPKNDKNAKRLIRLSLLITLIMAVITMVILLFCNHNIVEIFQVQEIGTYLYLIPLVILFAGFKQVAEQWLLRTNQFSSNAKANFLQSLITNVGKVGIGFVYPAAVVLVVLQTMGNGIKALMMIIFARGSNYRRTTDDYNESLLSVKELAKKHIDFPLYRAPETFISAFTQNLPVLLLTSLFGPASAGFYNIGRTVLELPSRFIGKSIGDVFYPRISKAANSGENLNILIKRATLALGGLGIIPFGLVILFGPWLFEFVFGTGWAVSGEYARWIALLSYLIFMNKPSIRSMPVLNAQRFHLIFTVSALVIQSLGLLLGFVVFKSDIVAIALFGILGALSHICFILITLNLSQKFSKKVNYDSSIGNV